MSTHVTENELLIVGDAPTVPGLTFRHFRGESDIPAFAKVNNALADAGQVDFVVSPEYFANIFAHLTNCDPSHDVIMVEVSGEVVAFARCWWRDEKGGPLVYAFNGQVMPVWQGKGITLSLLHWAEARLRMIAAGHPADRMKVLQRWVFHGQPAVKTLLENEGYAPVRYFNTMVRSSLDDIPDYPMPEGLEVRPALPEHYRLIWQAQLEAFRDHWGYTEWTEEDYKAWLEDPVEFQPDLWQIAWDVATNEVAGQVQTFIDFGENEKFNRARGYTEGISVRRPWRRQGLARALIVRSLRAQQERGMTESALGVDSDNLTGATRVYEDCGFRTTTVNTSYRKAL